MADSLGTNEEILLKLDKLLLEISRLIASIRVTLKICLACRKLIH